jgi:hypothetical protein
VAFWLNRTFPWPSIGNHIFSFDGVYQRTLSQAILYYIQPAWCQLCAFLWRLSLFESSCWWVRSPYVFFFTCTLLLLSLHGFERCFESLCRCLPCKVQQQKEVLPGPLLALGWFESCFKHSKSDSNCKGETYGNVLDPRKLGRSSEKQGTSIPGFFLRRVLEVMEKIRLKSKADGSKGNDLGLGKWKPTQNRRSLRVLSFGQCLCPWWDVASCGAWQLSYEALPAAERLMPLGCGIQTWKWIKPRFHALILN